MQGHKVYNKRTTVIADLRKMIPDCHLLVKIERFIDFSFIYDLTKECYCENKGRPSIDPILFFRMQIISYLYNIKSDRQLCKEINLNIAYRWFCGLNLEESVPNHSSLTRIRDRFGVGTYRAIFEKLITKWQESGIIKCERMMSDASIFEANASMDSLVVRKDGDPAARELRIYEQRYHDFKTGIKKRKLSNQTHVSKTDPDSSLVSRNNYYRRLYYKVHYSIDAASRIITDCYLTTGARHECSVFIERVSYQLSNFNFNVKEWIADKGYGRGPTYQYLKERNILSYIPLHDDNLGEGRLSRGEFVYDRKQDRYLCPEGYYLYPYEKIEGCSTKRYRMVGRHCKNCSLKAQCLPGNYTKRARFIYRSLYQDKLTVLDNGNQHHILSRSL